MVFNNFKFNIIVRVIVITLTILLFANLSASGTFLLIPLLVLALVVIQVIALIKFIDKTNEEISSFFESLKDQEKENIEASPDSGEYYRTLTDQYNREIEKLKNTRAEKDAKYQYLKTIVQHVGIGIITFNKDGEIQIMNTAAKRLFRISHIKNIDELRKISEGLVNSFHKLRTGGKDLIKIIHSDETIQLAVFAIELTLQDEEFKLVSLQNIQTELEENEMEAWQKLVRVLTHEIMNSVTPISSLANTLEEDIKLHLDEENEKCEMTLEELEDLHLAIKTIQKRSDGLIRFVTDFRSLTHIPKTQFSEVPVKDLFDHIDLLMRHELDSNKVAFKKMIDPQNLNVKIDRELIEQVLINLIKNAIQALEEQSDRQISLTAFKRDHKHTFISVRDNGPGIDEEAQSKIFIPFYTTKKNGSGIGLSLSKQIMRQHLGSISVKSKSNEGTEFILRF
jgi:two-component system, NtrC family, nitrogen regulation sensor histidine kinase NtrY